MIQIIGLLLCLYLFVKGFEFIHRQQCSSREDRRGSTVALIGFVLCVGGAFVFALMLLVQGADPALRPPRF